MKTYEYIIVGTGQATGTLLGKLVSVSKSIAVIEGNKIGGSCVNYGCTPTKTMVASARAIHLASKGDFYGFSSGVVSTNFERVSERMNEVRNASSDGLSNWIRNTPNIDFYEGYASFTGEKCLRINKEVVTGQTIFINVGTRPAAPAVNGIENVPWMDSARLLDLKELPEHLIILGGGYIGVEFGQVYKRLGSRVTILQRGSQLMPKEDEDIANNILEILTEEKIDVKLNSNVIEVESVSGKINLTFEQETISHNLQGSHLLVAAGRKPNSDTLELQNAGIEVDERGFIRVDEYCRTNIEGVFALGDVNGHGAFTHTSVNDAEVVMDFLFGGSRSLKTRIPVYALFSDPPLGRVGLTEKEAAERGYSILKATKPMSEISRAKEMGETKGFAKLLVDAETDLIIGAAILGPGGDEIVNMFAAIMHSNIPCKNYREVVLVHPTVSELMPWVLDGLKPL